MNIKDVINHRLKALDIGKAEAARRAGRSDPSFINNILFDKTRGVTDKTLKTLSAALSLDEVYFIKPQLYADDFNVPYGEAVAVNQTAMEPGSQAGFTLRGSGNPPPQPSNDGGQQGFDTRKHMGAPVSPTTAQRSDRRITEHGGLAAKSLPVFASAQGGDDGSVVIGSDPIDWISRPEPLLVVSDAYAVYLTGDSMEPAYDHGDLILVNPHLPPKRGDDVILQSAAGDRALLKRIVATTPQVWTVEQFNPKREFNLTRTEWPTAHAIIGRYTR